MDEKMITLEYVVNSETIVVHASEAACQQPMADWLDLINFLLKVSCPALNEQIEPNSLDGYFNYIAYDVYVRLPYTLKAVYNLWLKGYYLEASIINRHIIEGFAKLRYFYNHREQIEGHLGDTRRISFKKMFDTCAPGYYKRYYGDIHSDIAHGGIIAFMFRAEYKSPTEGEIFQGCVFKPELAKLAMSQPLHFGYGYLSYLDVFFPSVLQKFDSTIQQEREDLRSRLKGHINSIDDTGYKSIIFQFFEK